MFDDANYSGNWFWLDVGYHWNDLTEVSRGEWFGGDWNDEISSLSNNNTLCVYYEHIYLGGSSLLLSPFFSMPNLESVGWNDRISSVLCTKG